MQRSPAQQQCLPNHQQKQLHDIDVINAFVGDPLEIVLIFENFFHHVFICIDTKDVQACETKDVGCQHGGQDSFVSMMDSFICTM